MNTDGINDQIDEDDEDDEDNTNGELVLVFTVEGQCVLEEDDELVWASDDDDDFAVSFGNEFLDSDTDSRQVLNYLEEEGIIEPEEKADVEIEQEIEVDNRDQIRDSD